MAGCPRSSQSCLTKRGENAYAGNLAQVNELLEVYRALTAEPNALRVKRQALIRGAYMARGTTERGLGAQGARQHARRASITDAALRAPGYPGACCIDQGSTGPAAVAHAMRAN